MVQVSEFFGAGHYVTAQLQNKPGLVGPCHSQNMLSYGIYNNRSISYLRALFTVKRENTITISCVDNDFAVLVA